MRRRVTGGKLSVMACATTTTATATLSEKEVTRSIWMDRSHILRPSPPVNLLSQLKEYKKWASNDFVLQRAREREGMFTSPGASITAQLQQCLAEDFIAVNESLGVFACLKHMVVHRCGELWHRLKGWLNLEDDASLQCRPICIGGSNEPGWCCTFSRKHLPNSDALRWTMQNVQTSSDLAIMVYGTGRQREDKNSHSRTLVGGTMETRKRNFDDAFSSGVMKHGLLRKAIMTMVKALVDENNRRRYNDIIQKRSGRPNELLQVSFFTLGVQLLLQKRLVDLCEYLLKQVDTKDIDALIFYALKITVEGSKSGPNVIFSRLPIKGLIPLPLETVFEEAFGICLGQYSKTVMKISRVTGDESFAQNMCYVCSSCISSDKWSTSK